MLRCLCRGLAETSSWSGTSSWITGFGLRLVFTRGRTLTSMMNSWPSPVSTVTLLDMAKEEMSSAVEIMSGNCTRPNVGHVVKVYQRKEPWIKNAWCDLTLLIPFIRVLLFLSKLSSCSRPLFSTPLSCFSLHGTPTS